jgi:uncharacterized membrane protein
MIHKKIVRKKLRNGAVRIRNHEVYRIETFSDGVFAFALTLLIVSLEVPKSFAELKEIIWGFPAFLVGAFFLFLIWSEQNEFFRSYGMKDKISVRLNAVLLFVVLFYVYPIKFLFTVLFSHNKYLLDGTIHYRVESAQQNAEMLLIYAAGFIMVYVTFLMLYSHVLRKKNELQLNELEIFQTRTSLYSRMLMIAIGISSVLITLTGKEELQVYAGLIFILIWPVLFLFFGYRSGKMKKIFKETELIEYAQLIKH